MIANCINEDLADPTMLDASGSHEPRAGSMVVLNLYHVNGMVELLNRLVLQANQMCIFHCGVEVYSFEWSFVFMPNEGNETTNPLGTGVVENKPKKSPHFKFCESINVGWTDLSAEETEKIVLSLSADWKAHSYHITRRNCLSFAEALVERLGLGFCFPKGLKNVCEETMKSPKIASFVDSSWECTKWLLKSDPCARICGLLHSCVVENFCTACNSCRLGEQLQGAEMVGCMVCGRHKSPLDAQEEWVCVDNSGRRSFLLGDQLPVQECREIQSQIMIGHSDNIRYV